MRVSLTHIDPDDEALLGVWREADLRLDSKRLVLAIAHPDLQHEISIVYVPYRGVRWLKGIVTMLRAARGISFAAGDLAWCEMGQGSRSRLRCLLTPFWRFASQTAATPDTPWK
jgi:hypothetical protein